MASFSTEERKELARALAEGLPLTCPACGARVSREEVRPSRQVAYVRRRVLLVCPSCGKGGALDVTGGGPP